MLRNIDRLQRTLKNDPKIVWTQSTRFGKAHDLYFLVIEISGVLGTILGTMDIIEIHKNFMNFKDFYVFHMHMCHSNGTQVVPKISK